MSVPDAASVIFRVQISTLEGKAIWQGFALKATDRPSLCNSVFSVSPW